MGKGNEEDVISLLAGESGVWSRLDSIRNAFWLCCGGVSPGSSSTCLCLGSFMVSGLGLVGPQVPRHRPMAQTGFQRLLVIVARL